MIITLCQCRQVVYLLLSTTNYRSYPYLRSTETNWQSFWDSFNSGVHDNISLSDVQKFNYLNSLLVGEALSVEEGLAHTNVNYIKAIDLLNERYRQPHKITRIYMHALLDLLNRLIPYTVWKNLMTRWKRTSVDLKLWTRRKSAMETCWYQ